MTRRCAIHQFTSDDSPVYVVTVSIGCREYESAKKFDLKPIIVPLWFGQVSFDEITVRVRYLSRCLYKLALLSCVSQQWHIFSLVLKRYLNTSSHIFFCELHVNSFCAFRNAIETRTVRKSDYTPALALPKHMAGIFDEK